ncbi:PREDICTED: zinc finger BED domain-containing protein 1-like [Wasmannia auropunctata]|uniref:zinc finger BED domain-containing protein 1-like n=1 Tax=Wasmannia auropunctata TaxID=64793 RepID=UPI0005ED4A75|nr:PREDICTED: zinc finger BED domain-containing protein 1-like [Wasmannia auropunctata]
MATRGLTPGKSACSNFNRRRVVKSGGKGGGTTNLSNHLKRNHAENKEVKLTLKKSENSNETPNSDQVNNSKQLQLLSMTLPSTSTFTYMDLSESELATPISSPAPSLSESESRFCYSDKTTVDNEGFRNLMKTIAPLYSVPGRKSITKKMEEKYEYLKGCEKQKLEKIDYFSVTADIWTDVLNTISYLGITIHYAFEGELQATTIGVKEMTERHTSEVIGRWMKMILEDWNIDDEKIVFVVTDNGANIKKAVRDTFGSNRHIACFAHSINLVAQDTMNFETAISLCAKVKKIVTYFKQSTIAADAL